MSSFNRFSYLASEGNLPVKPAGEKVVLEGDDVLYSVYTGEIVVWDPRKNVTLGPAEIATAQHVSIGIGQGPEGSLAEDILHIGGEEFNLCNTQFCPRVSKPVCGIPQVVDIFFDCTKCNDVYTIALHLDDARIRSQYSFNDKAEYVFSVPTECCTCDDCDPEHNCEEVACAFVDMINGKTQKDPSKITYFRKADLSKQYQPFTATRLFNKEDSTKRFCLALQDDACEDCAYIPAITGMTVDGTSYEFTHTVSPKDTSKTLPVQLKRVVTEMNKVLEGIGGSAVLSTKGPGKCCPYSIEVNTCADTVTLTVDGAELDPCETENPFSAQDKEKACKGCGVTPDEINLNCGFRIIVDPLEVPCDCYYPPNIPVPNTYSRTVTPQFAGDGWVCYNHYWKESQAQVLPEGFGYYYQDRAHYGQHNGGTARDWRYSNKRRGMIGLPDKYSRAVNAHNLIDCNETYCVYNIETTQSHTTKHNNALNYFNKDLSQLLIPERDTVTQSTFEPILAALQARGICCAGNISCGVLNDQAADGDLVVGTATTVDVAANDTSYCDGTTEYVIVSAACADATISGTTLTVTPTEVGKVEVVYEVLCDGIKIGEATYSGVSEQA